MTLTKNHLQITQFIQASCEAVFAAWTRPESLSRWCCPELCQITQSEGNVKVGESYRTTMHCNGENHTCYGTYREIIPNRKIVFTHQWEDDQPVETLVTVELSEEDDGTEARGTEVRLTQQGFTGPDQARGHQEGWASALQNLSKYLTQ